MESVRSDGGGLDRAPRMTLITACAGCAIVFAVTAALFPALPVIARELELGQSDQQWIGDGYPLVLAALLLPAGVLLDRHGRRRGMLVGLVVLAAGLAWSAAAPGSTGIIAGRCVSGAGAAFVFPATLATITAVTPADRRGGAVTLWAASIAVGGAIGLVGGAVVVDLVSWRASLGAAGLVVLALVPLTARFVPETRTPQAGNLDPVGAVAAIVGIAATISAITHAPVAGWDSPETVALAALGLAGIAGFVLWELRVPRPLLDVRLLANPRVGSASLVLFLMFVGDFALLFLAFQFESVVLGMGAVVGALGLMPGALGVVLPAVLAPRLTTRYGRGAVHVGALLLCALGCGLGAVLLDQQHYWPLIVVFFVFWAGLGLGMGPATEAIIEGVPAADQGVASAVNDLVRELGAAVGIAIAGSAFNTGYRHSIASHGGDLPTVVGSAVSSSPAAGSEAIGRLDAPQVDVARAVIVDATQHGTVVALGVCAVVIGLGALLIAWRHSRHHVAEAVAPEGA